MKTPSLTLHPALAALDALSAPPPSGLPSLLGSTSDELAQFALSLGEKRFRGEQIFRGLYSRRAKTFGELTDLPKVFRESLEKHFSITRPTCDAVQVSRDGTRKYRFVGPDGTAYEAVYIPEVAKGSRTNTLCVSSQSGCAVGCKFCFTASLKRNRNLAASEIVGQVMAVQDDVQNIGPAAKITNIVFMGMGEPLLNYEQVIRSIRVLMDDKGLGFSTRRITVSTSGIVPRIYELGRDVPTQLAISLNATTDEIRDKIMPINKKWGLAELINALRVYPLPPRRRFTIEYVLLGGINDSIEDARRLHKLLGDLPVKINLLPLNPHDRTEFSPPSEAQVDRFQSELRRLHLHALRRTARGEDISAACGQLGETVTQL